MREVLSYQNFRNKISRPSKVKFALLALLSFMHLKSKGNVINKIGPYSLSKKIKKLNGFNNFFVGIYKKGKKRYFVKTWSGKIKDYHYQAIINELIVNKILFNSLLKDKVRTPKIIEYFSGNNSLSLVYEYIDGKPLSLYPLKKQTEVMAYIIKYLQGISSKDSNHKLSIALEKKDKLFYYFALCYITLLALISFPKEYRLIIKAYVIAVVKLFNVKNQLVISHGDLDPSNILISKKSYFLVDCGKLTLTLADYDLSYISTTPYLTDLSKKVSMELGKKANKFLMIFLCLQNLNIQDPKNGKFHYLERLKNII